MPAAADARVGLVDTPVRAYRLPVPSRSLSEERKEALHPPIDRALVNEDAALGQPLADFGVTEPLTHVPADRQRDDVVGEGTPRAG